jgi:hypothetical protein
MELALSYSFSWLAFLMLVFGFLWSLRDWRDYKIRVLAVFFLFNFILAEQHIINNQARYIFTCVPAFFLLGTYGLVQFWPKLQKVARKIQKNQAVLGITLPFTFLGVIILAKDFLLFPKMITPTGSHQIQSAAFYEQDYQNNLSFDFNRSHWPKIPPPAKTERIPDLISFVLENVDLNKNIYLVGGIDELNRGIFDFYLEKAREKSSIPPHSKQQEFLVVLQVDKSSRFDTLAYRYFGKLRGIDSALAAQQALADKSLTKITEKKFPYLGLTVTILGR